MKRLIATVALVAALLSCVAVTTAGATPRTRANAVRSAKSYLSFEAFSWGGLVEQLRFEGYSRYDARYGATHASANWMRQAVRAAKSYLRTMPFSRRGMIEQLEFDKFTHRQAVHGAIAAGL
jgi:Host cell surface-exposed lipoprotein